jgi:hypothetical protein
MKNGTEPAAMFLAAIAESCRSTSSSPAKRGRSTGPLRRAACGTSSNNASIDFTPIAASMAERSVSVSGR